MFYVQARYADVDLYWRIVQNANTSEIEGEKIVLIFTNFLKSLLLFV